MKLSRDAIRKLAHHLESCELEARATVKITDEYPGMDREDAYAIQDEIRRRKTERGIRIIGFKAGLTSRAKMRQMGVETPIFGFLADYFALPDGAEVHHRELIHPRVEPELAFVMKRPLRGPGCHVGSVMAATEFILPAIEVIDSRYRDFRFDLESVIADNASSARFSLGGRASAAQLPDLRTLGVVLEKNGEPVAFGAGAAVLGHPAVSIAMLVNEMSRKGEELPAGSVVLTGGVTEAIPVAAGDAVKVHVQGLGSVGLRFR